MDPEPRVDVALSAADRRAYVACMAAARVLVVSDSHLSPRTPEAHRHWDALVDVVAADPPDLVVHAGDISTDGALRPGDLADARAAVERVAVPVAVLPGNHDVGDGAGWSNGETEAVVSADTLARYRSVFGADRFASVVGAWQVIGLDAQLLGSGDPAEDEQWAWLAAVVDDVPHRAPVALVLHKPLVPPAGEADSPHRYVPAPERGRLLSLLEGLDLRLVVSGHIHQALEHERDGLRHVWAPSSWGVLPERLQRSIGAKRVGAVLLTLHDDGADVAQVRLPGVEDVVIGTDVASPYPEPDGPLG